MYHCHVSFYLAGSRCRAFEIIKEISPLEQFAHEFVSSDLIERPAAPVSVIIADVRDRDERAAAESLTGGGSSGEELILIADREQVSGLSEFLPKIKDLWIMPMSDEEVRFRFLRWQEGYKLGKDLWESGQYLESTINHVPNLVWYKTRDGIHEKVNDSFCRTVNKTREQVEGQGHAYIWDVEEDDPACIESEREVMTRRQTCVSEEVVKTGEGMKLLTTYKSPLYDVDGSVMGTVGVAIDVTQERAYEQEIIEKNQTLETIFTTMDCGILCHTVDGRRIISVNRAALEILGYEDVRDMAAAGFDMVADSVMEEDKEKLRESIRELNKEGDSTNIEYRVQKPDGEIRHIMGNIKLLRENGQLQYQRFLLDCTAQKLREKEHERHQMELIHALSIDYSLVCFFDLDTGLGTPLRISDEEEMFASVFGRELSFGECMQSYIERYVYEEDQDLMRRSCAVEWLKKELSVKRQNYVNHRVMNNRDMKYFQMKVVSTGDWGESHGIVLGFRSVDEEIRSELEQKSALEDALSQANRASRAKSVFLSNMSHDIRTPMNAIVGFTSLALSHIDRTDQVEEYLKKIMTSGNHLLSLINDVLDMSRIESGKMRLDEKPCSLPDILHSLRNILQADIRSKQLELCIDAVDILDEEIYCDKLRLNQVLLNLLSNAVKYTPANGTISVRITEKPGGPAGSASYEFHISDTGIGMSEEFVAHIFEPFERETTSTISGIQGTGLGMAITKNIVDMMNGTIKVESRQNVGTEVTVTFTFRLNSENREQGEIPDLSDCRALVIDDDFNTCDSVSYMLGQLGLRAEWTLSGKEAVLRTRQAAMRGDSYGVYVVDWLLPDMNGIEVTRRIRKEAGSDVPIIILTAYDWADIEEEATEAGVTAFCSKPLFLSELRTCLISVMEGDEHRRTRKADTQVKHHTGRILLAEDNELNQEIAVAILSDAGFVTDVAQNGRIAVDMLKNSEPGYYQLVLMDVQMPVMNGYEATKAIRRLGNKELSSIPILAMTANAFEEDKREAVHSGMNGHIAKPIDIKMLFDTLDEILG